MSRFVLRRISTSLLPLLVAGATSLLTVGCYKEGEMARTPEQWRDEVQAQMQPLVPELRECWMKSKGGWAAHSEAMGGRGVANMMRPKPRETISIWVQIDSVNRGDRAKVTISEGHDATVPYDDQTSDGNLNQCVLEVMKKLKVPPKSDTYPGFGMWWVTFVPETPGGVPNGPPPAKDGAPAPAPPKS